MYSTERQFVTTANSQLRLLEHDTLYKHKLVQDAISAIKNAAGPVKARAVYRAALLCEDVLKRCDSPASIKFQTSLASLKSLVQLYANGLYEIDTEFEAISNGVTTPSGFEARAKSNTNQKIKAGQSQEHLKAANENAANILKPLLPLVRDNKRASALSFLAGIEHQVTNSVPSSRTHSRSSIRFDNIMRRITNKILGEARALAKNVSISYAAEFETVDLSISTDLQDFLHAACLQIVRDGLVVNGDLAASINRTWQISITGSTQGQDLSISLSWPGEKLRGFGESGKSKKILKNIDGKLTNKSEQHQGDGKLDIHILEFTCPGKKSEKPNLLQMDIQLPLVREG